MSARELPNSDVAAFALAALLEQYELDVEALAAASFDAEAYGRASGALDEMRLLCAGLPMLAVPWVHLMISHAELVHCVWRAARDGAARPAVACSMVQLLQAIAGLRLKARQLARCELLH